MKINNVLLNIISLSIVNSNNRVVVNNNVTSNQAKSVINILNSKNL